MKSYILKKVLKVTESSRQEVDDPVAIEKRLNLAVNGKHALSFYCTPFMIRELVVGFLMTEKIIKGSWCAERMSIEYGDEVNVDVPAEGKVSMEGKVITSGCIGGVTISKKFENKDSHSSFKIDRASLIERFKEFQNISEPYRLTGCMHSAAITNGKRILVSADDIGRHNAVDKVIGYCLMEDIALEESIMLVSGRLSSEIGSKCSIWNIPIVVSRTAPTLMSIEIAEKQGVTMVGFLRGKRFNIYTYPERILD